MPQHDVLATSIIIYSAVGIIMLLVRCHIYQYIYLYTTSQAAGRFSIFGTRVLELYGTRWYKVVSLVFRYQP
jgi:hypothetical protein